MANDPAVSPSDVGLIGAEDVLDDSTALGPVIRSTKYCKIHSVVASSWEAESVEAHVFQPTRKAEVRFLNRSVWPKLRKSHGFKRETKEEDGRTIFIVSDRQEATDKKGSLQNLKVTQASGLNSDGFDNTKPVTEAVHLDAPTTSTLPTPHQLPPGFNSSTVGKSIFLRYLRECHGDEPAPTFQSDGFPTPTEPKAAELEADAEPIKSFIDRQFPFVKETGKTPFEHKAVQVKAHEPENEHLISPMTLIPAIQQASAMRAYLNTGASSAIPTSWEEHSDNGTRRSKPRQTPDERHLHFVLGLAAEIAGESLESEANGDCLFGHGFMLEHLYSRQMRFLSSQALFAHADQQRAWTDRIGRTIQHLPELLKKQEAAAEKAWLASLEELRHIFGNQAAGGDQGREEQCPQNIVIMRWIVERSFSGFSPEAVAMLADSFACYTCAGEPVTRWMLRIRSHARMRKWAGQELSKAPDAPGRANSVLMRLVEAYTAHELVLGMKPLLERMLFVSQGDLGYWEGAADSLYGEEEAEVDSVSNRWKARRSVFKSKGIGAI